MTDVPPRGPRRPPRPTGDPAASGRAPGGPARPPRPPRPPAAAPAPRRAPRTAPTGAVPSQGAPSAPAPSDGRPRSGPGSHLRPPTPGRPSGLASGATTRPASTVAGLAEAARADSRRRARQAQVRRNRVIAGGALVVVLGLFAWGCSTIGGDDGSSTTASSGGGDQQAEGADGDGSSSGSGDGGGSGGSASTDDTPAGLAAPSDYDGWVDPASSGKPWSSDVLGQLTFRGNPTRSYYGLGPVPSAPKVLWTYPESGGMCSNSPVGGVNKTWCGSGWTGQPSVWEQDDRTWVAFGAYDSNIHFMDGQTGDDILTPYPMGDIIKGSVTRDPDGFPLLYTGSRADFHILAMDRPGGEPESLWSMSADNVSPVNNWNDDWDSSPLVIDDYLFEGGENGQWYIIKLNRDTGADGLVTVSPEIVFNAPGWDDELTADLAGSGSRAKDTSIENSLAISGNTVYFANSGGLVQGWDISGVKDGEDPQRVFRFWTGDDTDASVVIDAEGMLYVASERERPSSFDRTDTVGQLMKLDPSKPDDPLVWSVTDPASDPPQGACEEPACYGIWATPAIWNGMVYVGTNHGRILGVRQDTGAIVWEKKLPGPTWMSPVVVDDVMILGDCSGVLHGFDVSDPDVDPPELWTVQLEGCLESTPAVFQGRMYVGARGGKFYAMGDE